MPVLYNCRRTKPFPEPVKRADSIKFDFKHYEDDKTSYVAFICISIK